MIASKVVDLLPQSNTVNGIVRAFVAGLMGADQRHLFAATRSRCPTLFIYLIGNTGVICSRSVPTSLNLGVS